MSAATLAPLIIETREDLCLGFANTLFWRGSPEKTETLHGIDDLLNWLANDAHMGALGLTGIRTWSAQHQGAAARLFAEAIALREAIYRIFAAVAEHAAINTVDLDALNAALTRAPSRSRLVAGKHGVAWAVDALKPEAPSLLTAILWSASDLLTQVDHHRIRRCSNDKCLWLFVDRSKAGTRRWCDMKSCGNRAKAQRHYARQKHS